MRKRPFHAKCPCCGEKLAIDPELRRVEALDPTKRKEDGRLDAAAETLADDDRRRQDSFEAALEDEKKKRPSLDDLL